MSIKICYSSNIYKLLKTKNECFLNWQGKLLTCTVSLASVAVTLPSAVLHWFQWDNPKEMEPKKLCLRCMRKGQHYHWGQMKGMNRESSWLIMIQYQYMYRHLYELYDWNFPWWKLRKKKKATSIKILCIQENISFKDWWSWYSLSAWYVLDVMCGVCKDEPNNFPNRDFKGQWERQVNEPKTTQY